MKKDNYLIKTLNGMAYGFFCSLIIGTILKQIGDFTKINELVVWGNMAGYLMGPAIGVGIAYAIEAKGLNLIAAIIAGSIGAGTFNGNVASAGNPIAAFVAVIVAVELTRLIQGKTPVDILLVPFTSIVATGASDDVCRTVYNQINRLDWRISQSRGNDAAVSNVDCGSCFNGDGFDGTDF